MKALLTLGLLIISAPVLAGQVQNDTKIPRNVWDQPSLKASGTSRLMFRCNDHGGSVTDSS